MRGGGFSGDGHLTEIGRRRLFAAGLAATGLSVTGVPTGADEPVMIYAGQCSGAHSMRWSTPHVVSAPPVTLFYGPTPSPCSNWENGLAGIMFFFSADADWTNATVARGIAQASTRNDLAVPAAIQGFDFDRAVVLQNTRPWRTASQIAWRETAIHSCIRTLRHTGAGEVLWLFGLK